MKFDPNRSFNADEVFGMAERIEQNAADFYTKAACLHAQTSDVQFLNKLAAMELGHRDLFAALRAKLPPASREPPAADPYLKASIYLNSIADAGGGEGTLSNATPLAATDTLIGIVRRGIRMELEAVAFYVGVKEVVPAESGRSQIDRIIAEERGHVVVLADELRKLLTLRRRQ